MPLYYGMLMFALAAHGALVPAHLAPETSGLKAFAVRAPEGALRICLINQNTTLDERVAIDFGSEVYGCIHAAAGRSGHRCYRRSELGGASVDEFGRWAPLMHGQVHLTGNEIIVDVPAASAALVSLRG